jgi:hypothetical protein
MYSPIDDNLNKSNRRVSADTAMLMSMVDDLTSSQNELRYIYSIDIKYIHFKILII